MKLFTTTVSVIMPAYNCAEFLPVAISSVRAQTYTNWELLVIDDASTDNTATIVEEYAAQDARIRLIRLAQNTGGVNGPRNAGLEEARGRYIAFLDGDDYWLETKLATQLDFMQSKDSAISFTAYRRITPDNKITGHEITAPAHVNLKTYLSNTCIGVLTSMVDREKTGDFRVNPKSTGEFEMWTDLLKNNDAHFLNMDLARYRRGHNSMSSNILRAAFKQAGAYYRLSKDIGVVPAGLGFVGYAANAVKKRLRF